MENDNNTNVAQKETTAILQGEKINKNKQILIGWIIVLVLFSVWLSIFVAGWIKYTKYQNKCLEAMKIIYSSFDRSIPDNDKEFIEKCAGDLSPDRVDDLLGLAGAFSAIYGGEINTSEADFVRTLQTTTKAAFEAIGYPLKWDISYVFKFENIFQYAKGIINGLKDDIMPKSSVLSNYVTIVFFSVAFLLVLVTQIVYNLHKHQKIILEDNKIRCKMNKEKEIEILYSRIQAVKRGPYRSVRILSPGARASVTLLKNQVEIVNQITDKMHQN